MRLLASARLYIVHRPGRLFVFVIKTGDRRHVVLVLAFSTGIVGCVFCRILLYILCVIQPTVNSESDGSKSPDQVVCFLPLTLAS